MDVWVVKFVDNDSRTCDIFKTKDSAYQFAYKKAYYLHLKQQIEKNNDRNHPINHETYINEYIKNKEKITVVSKKLYQSADYGYGDLYSSVEIKDNESNVCINNFKFHLCFAYPEKYEKLSDCVNGCCQIIKWTHKIEYNFEPFISYEEYYAGTGYFDYGDDSFVNIIQDTIDFDSDESMLTINI